MLSQLAVRGMEYNILLLCFTYRKVHGKVLKMSMYMNVHHSPGFGGAGAGGGGGLVMM